jgi:hypothetical protein
MATNSSISVTEGSGKNIATYSISETTTKELQRMVASTSAGAEITTFPISIAATVATSLATNTPTGVTASGATLVSNPLTTGGRAAITNPTAVADGQVVNAMFTKHGKQVVVGSVRDLKANQITTITSSTSETTVVTAVASTFMDIYGCIVVNSSATATNVSFKDSTAGTTRFNIYVPAGETRGFMLPESGAFNQTTVNNNWTATSSASVASLIITMLSVKNI